MNQRIPILVYHHVYPDGAGELDVNKTGECTGVIAESAFRRQMQYLADNKMEVVSTSNVVDWLIDDAPLPEHAVVLHFEDFLGDGLADAVPGALGEIDADLHQFSIQTRVTGRR